MRMIKKPLCFLIAAIANQAFSADIDWQASDAKGRYFFEQSVPSAFSHEGGQLTVSKKHYRDGSQSLLWQFPAQGKLYISAPIAYDPDNAITPNTFLAWIYNETPSDDVLVFQLGTDDTVNGEFSASLNFSGWRGIAMPLRDLQGKAVKGMNKLTVTAPNREGELYIDQVMLGIPVDNRWPVPDDIVPTVNPSVNTSANKNWDALLMYDQWFRKANEKVDFTQPLKSNDKDAALYQKVEETIGLSQNAVTEEKIEENLSAYKKFAIQEKDGVITAPPVEFPARQNYMKAEGLFSDAEKSLFFDQKNDLREIGKTLKVTAQLLRNPTIDDKHRALLEAQFLLTTRYLFDQGFTLGSGMQIITHLGYQSREVFDAWFLARDLLQQHHLLAQAAETMRWYSATGRIYEADADIIDANVDILNTQLQWMIKSVLLMPNAQQRDAVLKQLSHWLSLTIVNSKGVGGGFKPDGSVFHHSQHYPAYARDAFNGLAPALYVLSDSAYAVSEQAEQRVVDAFYKMWVYTKGGEFPIVLSGRHPTGKFKAMPEPYKWLAKATTGQAREQLAGIYARLNQKEAFDGVSAAKEPVGGWVMNHAGMYVQRRHAEDNTNSWLAIARGFSRYLVGNEAYQSNNRYSRYLSYGGLEIMPSDYSKRAFSLAGWDWNRYPGVTMVYLPYADLKSQLNQLPSAGIEEMLLSTESYLGATGVKDNGVFAVKLHGHRKYHQEDFYANKSYFFFDNRVVALGSGINNNDDKNPTETVLFQHALPTNTPIIINGETINTLGTEKTLTGDSQLQDPAGHRYFVKNANVGVFYQHQTSVDDGNDQPTEGNFATAVIQHGVAPKDASYEYAITIEASNADKPNYVVLRHDNQVHAVQDALTQQEGYAFFNADTKGISDALVQAADAPSLVFAAPSEDHKTLALSVVNPDLGYYEGVEKDQVDDNGHQAEVSIYSREWRKVDGKPQTVGVVLQGKWQLMEESPCAVVNTKDNETNVKVTTVEAQSCQLTLKAE